MSDQKKMSFLIFFKNEVEKPVRDSHHQMKNPFMADSGIVGHHGFPHHVATSRLLTQNPHVDAGFLNGAFGTNFLHGGASAFTAHHAASNGPRYWVNKIQLFLNSLLQVTFSLLTPFLTLFELLHHSVLFRTSFILSSKRFSRTLNRSPMFGSTSKLASASTSKSTKSECRQRKSARRKTSFSTKKQKSNKNGRHVFWQNYGKTFGRNIEKILY